MPLKDLEARRNYSQKYRAQHLEQVRTAGREYYQSNKTLLSLDQRGRRHLRKVKVLMYYSNPSGAFPICNNCGEQDVDFLCLDHIFGGGTQQKKEVGENNFLSWLCKNNLPEGEYQVLCANCNLKKSLIRSENSGAKYAPI